jgi:hypothetical protein
MKGDPIPKAFETFLGNLQLYVMAKQKPDLTRVGECLWRHRSPKHYAIVRVRGKQIKRTLKTSGIHGQSRYGRKRCNLTVGLAHLFGTM